MARRVLLACLSATTAVAFVAGPGAGVSSSALRAAETREPPPGFTAPYVAPPVEEMVGASVETGIFSPLGDGVYDPLGFSQISALIKDSEHYGVWPSTQWLREAEIKHGRVAMLAFVGAVAQSLGAHFPGSLGGFYYEAGVNPFEAFGSAVATNKLGMFQIFLAIHIIETKFWPEGAWLGKMTSRAPGDLGLNFGNKAADEKHQLKELKNGRAAMIGIIGLSCAHFIPGSVPFPPGGC